MMFVSSEDHPNIEMWNADSKHHAPEIFGKIHYLRAFNREDRHGMVNTDVATPAEWKKQKESTTKKIIRMQESSLSAMNNGITQLDLSSGDLELILEYLRDHKSVSHGFYTK